jgi:hypothetical protein
VYEKNQMACQFYGVVGHEMDVCTSRNRLARLVTKEDYEGRIDLKNILEPKLGS